MNVHIKMLSILIEQIAASNNMHIALTGGQLYKSGARKDIDFVLYHATSSKNQGADDRDRVIACLIVEGFTLVSRHGRVDKLTFEGDDIDILYPEYTGEGEYDVKPVAEFVANPVPMPTLTAKPRPPAFPLIKDIPF